MQASRRTFLGSVALSCLALSSVALSSVALTACSGGASHDHTTSGGARCAYCGMAIAEGSPWRAGATRADGTEAAFDTPKCLFRWMTEDEGRGAREPWVTEYYSAERRPAEGLRYVLGSDVEGPMGADLVPIEGQERAERFSADHHGERVLERGAIDAALLDALFR